MAFAFSILTGPSLDKTTVTSVPVVSPSLGETIDTPADGAAAADAAVALSEAAGALDAADESLLAGLLSQPVKANAANVSRARDAKRAVEYLIDRLWEAGYRRGAMVAP